MPDMREAVVRLASPSETRWPMPQDYDEGWELEQDRRDDEHRERHARRMVVERDDEPWEAPPCPQ